ncbi:hypothetical protein KCP75_20560 [Salmonella enterica subsp. enterica]|nr:hypothetical protein KCP75_20560 [Salmonella enterica subsp. enterica]
MDGRRFRRRRGIIRPYAGPWVLVLRGGLDIMRALGAWTVVSTDRWFCWVLDVNLFSSLDGRSKGVRCGLAMIIPGASFFDSIGRRRCRSGGRSWG